MSPLVRCAWLAAIVLTLGVVLCNAGCQRQGPSTGFWSPPGVVHGSGPVVRETRPLPDDCRMLAVGGTYTVHLVDDPHPGITVEAQAAILPLIATTCERGTLTIDSRGSYTTGETVTITVRSPAIRSVQLSGSADAEVEAVDAGTLAVHCDGAAQATLRGRAARLEAVCSGSSRIDAARLAVTAASTATSEGSSHIVLAGRSGSATLTAGGASTIEAGALQVDDATLHADGAATITLGAAARVQRERSGVATITVAGSAP